MTLPLYCPQYIQNGNALNNNNNNNNMYHIKREQCGNVVSKSNLNAYTNFSANHENCHYKQKLPSYQSRQNRMLEILREYETLPLYLVSGFIRDIWAQSVDEIIIPQDLINLCFKFYQHDKIAKYIDSSSCDELYAMAWEATENEEYLFAEQLIAYLLGNNKGKKKRKQQKEEQEKQEKEYHEIHINRQHDEDASTTNLMAVIKYFLGDYKSSESYFKMASLIDPSCDIIMNNYAVLLLEQGRFIDAEKEILSAIRVNPQCIKNHQQYAYILFSMGSYELAAKECQLMILLQPNIESYSGYAWLLEQMGKYKESVIQYEELIKLEPMNATWYYWYALLLLRCQKYKLSKQNFEKCLQIDPKYEGVNGIYAYSLYLNGDLKNAYKYIQIALNKESDCKHLCVHYYYALIIIQLNNIQTAVNELYQCLELIQENKNLCKNEKGCLSINEHHIYNLLTDLGY